MKIRVFLVFAVFMVSLSHGQQELVRFPTYYEEAPYPMENSFSLVDDTSGDFTVFLTKKSKVSAYFFLKNFEFHSRLYHDKFPTKYRLPLGGTIKEKKYSLFFSNDSKNKFAGITFDFESGLENSFEINLNLKKEIFIISFTHHNTFYLVSASYRENYLYLYEFNNNGEYVKKNLDLTGYDFYGNSEYKTRLKSTLALDMHNNPITEPLLVKSDIPYSLDSMISLIKLYLDNDSFYLVSDINKDFSQIIKHNFVKERTEVFQINQPINSLNYLNNSFLRGDKLFQIKVSTKELHYQISNIKNKSILKKYTVKKDDELFLTNGTIRQRGGRFKNYRELEKTSQFLRKIGNGNLSIYVEKADDDYHARIGSVAEIEDGVVAAVAFLNPFTVVASFGALTLFANPAALAFYKASKTKAVYINNGLDNNLEITPTKEKENIFYTIQDYLKEQEIKRYSAADIFKYDDYFIFGMLDKKSKEYILLKFEGL
ncbi:hypothetical protein [Croceitalea rosinachiae]|uniref:Uncharacterized protein n=1 Tax=Croceitalea rosinachiae TaxID=3075596 RepID=A0ABU3A7G2_9FLAO|nr:hypothetical protein [Croceitalea sp. F388]MDT0605894.1 hypothetical protein [Croceitalea sp. F388]